jgi:branched-chain amino acid transport system permease protein
VGGAVAAVVVVLAFVPFLGVHPTWVASQVLVLAIFAGGYNLLFGYTGLLSFGHGALYAVGAYISAFVLLAWPSLPAALVGGTLAAGLVSVVIGWLSIRHTRIYFAMLTLAFGMMIHSIIFRWRSVTGGDDGVIGIPRGVLGVPGAGLELSSLGLLYYVVLAVAVVALWLLWRIVSSPLGLTLRGLRDSETRVAFSGLSVRPFRLLAFTISGLYAGLAGSLTAPLASAATPALAHWTTSADPVLATLLGGAHTFAGPFVGAFLLVVVKEVVVRYTQYWLLVLGIIVVVLVLGFRGGVAGAVGNLAGRTTVGRRLGSKASGPAVTEEAQP